MTLTIRPLDEADVPAADRIFRQAFSKFLGIPDPQAFTGDAAILATRWRANPDGALGAYQGDTLVGSSFAGRWGSFGFLGPVSVRTDLWDQGVAKRLVEQTVALLDRWAVRQAALFTFPQSAKHIALYQKFGFWPRYLTPVMSKPVAQAATKSSIVRYSKLSPTQQAQYRTQCSALTDRISPGLDVQAEIAAITDQNLGETIFINDALGLAGLACCHIGAGSEAGTATTFVKFGAVRPGGNASELFERLLDGCEALAAESGSKELVAGINAARHAAYRQMIERGFRTFLEGVAMLRPNEPAFNRPDCFVIDDLR